jgi:hypothetical protein
MPAVVSTTDAMTTSRRTSMMSARPAPAIPMRNSTSRVTNDAANTRPRISRGVFRWSKVRLAMPKGAFRKPVIMTMTIATWMFGASP